MNSLNPAQLEAVKHTEGPLLILAGAGSGKTRVLTYRIFNLVKNYKIDPHNILAVTFTNKAAREMKERLEKILGFGGFYWAGTFHSICVKILRREYKKSARSDFLIYDTTDSKNILKQVIKELELDPQKFTPQMFQYNISSLKNRYISSDNFKLTVNDYFSEKLSIAYDLYEKKLALSNALDFDDLINKTIKLFRDEPDTLKKYQDIFRYILVDEYQDVNYCQYLFIRDLAGIRKNICVVGDDDQSIYGFRGADVSIIRRFMDDFPGARTVKLEQNYRSCKNVLNVANEIIKYSNSRTSKILWTQNQEGEKVIEYLSQDEKEESAFIADEIRKITSDNFLNYGDIAILYRTNAQSRTFEEKLLQEGIPYVIVGGFKFYERKEIKDIMSYLRLIQNNNDDISFKRIINVPARGIGKISIDRLQDFGSKNILSLFASSEKVDAIDDISPSSRKKIKDFIHFIKEKKALSMKMSVTELVNDIFITSGYKKQLQDENTPDSQSRIENILELMSVTEEFIKREETPSLEEFLCEISLLTDIDEYKDSISAVNLMTLHSAKGLEFPCVFICGMEEGILPHQRSFLSEEEMQEERRLCYVGITRAKKHLYFTRSEKRTIFGITSYRECSRFLMDIDPNLLDKRKCQLKANDHKKTISFNKNNENKDKRVFKEGQEVYHKMWGRGIIADVFDNEITVEFPEKGKKTVMSDFLSIIS